MPPSPAANPSPTSSQPSTHPITTHPVVAPTSGTACGLIPNLPTSVLGPPVTGRFVVRSPTSIGSRISEGQIGL
ncbi:hypothetical protein P691DRAFT_222113 [Macrolepiota fuliginosa MF-IS2]|uniref:Uncharacterized protein n=1 Tax=Macrolepiota fuliginosa MF-IS2 TaxID=1400762 RepID=A0A9P5XKB1_9AGAR|nr:hypothetical protein P691DRAFT_222113 [Macrolepiota fuliginosa MF-IS2]